MIFVTGGTGLLGNNIVRELYQRGIRTRVLCRPGTPRTPFADLNVEVVAGDLHDPQLLRQAISGCQGVIHSAALIHIGWQRMAESRQVNVEGTRHIVEACLAASARLIHVSTVDTLPAATSLQQPIDERGLGGIPKPACAYVLSKREAEQEVREAVRTRGLDAVVVHPGFMLGPYDWKPSSGRMFQEVTKAPLVAAPAGGCSLCDPRQVAVACVNAIEQARGGENYILAGRNLSYVELWTQMLAVAGGRRRVFRLGRATRWLGRACDLMYRFFPIAEGDINSAALAMGDLFHYYDSAKAQHEIGYAIDIKNNLLSEAWEWLSSQDFR